MGNIEIYKGDITMLNVDAIVNAANSSLFHGGGVAGAIARAAGEEFIKESQEYIKKHGKVPTGSVAVTGAGKLKAKYVIHAVGPMGTKEKLLESAVENTFKSAKEYNVETIAIPAISCGIFGFDKRKGTEIIYRIAKKYENDFKRIILVSIDPEIISYWENYKKKG